MTANQIRTEMQKTKAQLEKALLRQSSRVGGGYGLSERRSRLVAKVGSLRQKLSVQERLLAALSQIPELAANIGR